MRYTKMWVMCICIHGALACTWGRSESLRKPLWSCLLSTINSSILKKINSLHWETNSNAKTTWKRGWKEFQKTFKNCCHHINSNRMTSKDHQLGTITLFLALLLLNKYCIIITRLYTLVICILFCVSSHKQRICHISVFPQKFKGNPPTGKTTNFPNI